MPGTSSESPELKLELPPVARSVTTARHAVAELARRMGASEADVKLAVSEAVGNAVVHAFRDREPGTIRLCAWTSRGRLMVAVADNGSGMMPNPSSPGLGFGISLISRLAKDARFETSDAGTTVSMSFASRVI